MGEGYRTTLTREYEMINRRPGFLSRCPVLWLLARPLPPPPHLPSVSSSTDNTLRANPNDGEKAWSCGLPKIFQYSLPLTGTLSEASLFY